MYEVTIICAAVVACTTMICFKGITVHYTNDTPDNTNLVHLRKLFESANEENNKEEADRTPDFTELLETIDDTYEEGLDYGNEPR